MAAEAGVASALGGRGYAGYGRACTVAVRMGCLGVRGCVCGAGATRTRLWRAVPSPAVMVGKRECVCLSVRPSGAGGARRGCVVPPYSTGGERICLRVCG